MDKTCEKLICLGGVDYPLEKTDFRGLCVGQEVLGRLLGFSKNRVFIKGFDSEKRWVVISVVDPLTKKEIMDDILVDESDLNIDNECWVANFVGTNELLYIRPMGLLGRVVSRSAWKLRSMMSFFSGGHVSSVVRKICPPR